MAKFEFDESWTFEPDLEALEELSNSVIGLIQDGRLDEAEKACLELKRRYPDMIDWIERTAEVHEARGHVVQAIEHYRRCIEFANRNPEDFDAESKEWYQDRIDRLE